jgi:hypothetical protein
MAKKSNATIKKVSSTATSNAQQQVVPLKETETKLDNKFQKQGAVKVLQESICNPHNGGLRFVLNMINLAGKVEGPLYSLIEKKWPAVKREVRGLYANKTGAYKLGVIAGNTSVQSDVWVLHMLCQDDDLKTDVESLELCLKEVCKQAKYEKATVHVSEKFVDQVPELQDLVVAHLVKEGVSVNFYQEPAGK